MSQRYLMKLNSDEAMAAAPSALDTWGWPQDESGRPLPEHVVLTDHVPYVYGSASREPLIPLHRLSGGSDEEIVLTEIPSVVVVSLAAAALELRLRRLPCPADAARLAHWRYLAAVLGDDYTAAVLQRDEERALETKGMAR